MLLRPLDQLIPGTRFRVYEQPEVIGTLLMVNECRARIRLDTPSQTIEFEAPDGSTRSFVAKRTHETSWAPTVLVEALSFELLNERDTTMATKKTTKKAGDRRLEAGAKTPSRKAAPQKSPPASRLKSPASMSQLDAAVKVLAEAGTPMTTKAMIDAMAAKGYWTSPAGKTPWATLYSALIREIATKGDESRFAKTDRGQFTLAGK